MNEQFTTTNFELHNQHLNDLRRRARQQARRPAPRATLWTALSARLRLVFRPAQPAHRKSETIGQLARSHS